MPIQTHGYLIARGQYHVPQVITGTPKRPAAVNASGLHDITVFPNEQEADYLLNRIQKLDDRPSLHVMRCTITMEILPL